MRPGRPRRQKGGAACLHDGEEALLQSEYGDDKLRRVTKGGVEQARDRLVRVQRHLLRHLAEQALPARARRPREAQVGTGELRWVRAPAPTGLTGLRVATHRER